MIRSITLSDILVEWRVLMSVLATGALLGALVATLQRPVYLAHMTISAVGMDETSVPSTAGVGGLGGRSVLNALGSLTGRINSDDSDFAYFVALLSSDRVATRLLSEPDILQELFRGEWDEERQAWRRPGGVFAAASGAYRRIFFGMDYQAPNVPRVKRALSKRFSLSFDLEHSTYVLAMKHERCDRATYLLEHVFTIGDSVLKGEKRVRFTENVDLLTRQLQNPPNIDIRSDIANALLVQQLRKITTESVLPIAARVIDGPGCDETPRLPRPIPYTFVGALVGLVLALAFVGWRFWRRESIRSK